MRPIFLDVRNGEKTIHWFRLIACGIATIMAGAALGELVAYLATGEYGVWAPAFGAVFAFFLAVRPFAAVMAYQPSEADEEVSAA